MALSFYRCDTCGNIVEKIVNGGGPLVCCGKPMTELTPNTTDAAVEKHVPVVEVKDGKVFVTVGSAVHPMTEAHYIEFIVLETSCAIQRVMLTPADEPKACFNLCCPEEEVKAVYAYCNLHGLWADK